MHVLCEARMRRIRGACKASSTLHCHAAQARISNHYLKQLFWRVHLTLENNEQGSSQVVDFGHAYRTTQLLHHTITVTVHTATGLTNEQKNCISPCPIILECGLTCCQVISKKLYLALGYYSLAATIQDVAILFESIQ